MLRCGYVRLFPLHEEEAVVVEGPEAKDVSPKGVVLTHVSADFDSLSSAVLRRCKLT